jgi:peptide/nickel transport system substrate-binding protein
MTRKTPLIAGAAVAAVLLAATACGSGGAKKTTTEGGNSNAVFTSIDANNAITAGAPMNPYNASANSFLGYNTMELGFDKKNPTDPSDFFPGIGASWTSAPGALTIHLQPAAKWSDGTPVTTDDVKMSLAIALTQGTATVGAGVLTQGLDVAGVKTIDAHTVEVDEVAGAHNLQFVRLVLGQYVVAKSVYGSMVPDDIWDTIAASQKSDAASADAAKAAVDKLNGIGKTISAFAPAKDLSAGPFVITRVNPGSVQLDRNQYFYDVKKISPAKVILRGYTGNEQIWGYLTNGELDASPFTATPTNVVQQITANGYKEVDAVSYVGASIAFNESVAPYDKREVRQALAYVIDRKAVTKVGEPVGGTASTATTGIVDVAAKTWLGADGLSALNPYNPDAAKAAQLLQSVGFTKSGNQWMLPDGTPWKITLQTVNGFSDWITASTVVANELTAFGIPTTPALTADFATYKKEMAAGKYPVGWWLVALGNRMGPAYQRLYGTDDGYKATGANVTHVSGDKSGNWYNTPTSYTVNGQTIDPGALTAKLSTIEPADQKPIVQQLAAATNQELPAIQIWDYTNVHFVTEKRFKNFPPVGMDGLLYNSPGVWMMQGYVQAK